MFVVDVHVEFSFYGPAGDSVTASAWGQGTDMGDKSPQKAYTSAFKSMLAQTFCIADSATDSERHDVPDTEQRDWYRDNGWESEAEHDAYRAETKQVLASLPETAQKAFKEWRQSLNLDLSSASTRAEAGQMRAKAAELKASGNPEGPASDRIGNGGEGGTPTLNLDPEYKPGEEPFE
jgi:hypothetical protein